MGKKHTIHDTVRCPECNKVVKVAVRDIEIVGEED